MGIILRPYQSRLIDGLGGSLGMGHKNVIAQLATGGGKTITFSALTSRYENKNNKDVLILVHREELFMNTRTTLYKSVGVNAFPIDANTKRINRSRVYVGMVETVNNRINKGDFDISNIGLVIMDEAHLGNFNKLLEAFKDAYIIGFTATPISARKKEPLVDYFDDIVCGIDIPDLIESGNLLPCHTYSTKENINRAELAVRGGEFDAKTMGAKMSSSKCIQNTIKWYEDLAKGTKTIIFNANVSHSKLVTEAFVEAGYNARHLDAKCSKEERRAMLKWFKETPDAILCNVAILTTGFDEPSIQTVIVNRATKSLPLWLQMTGRGARPFPGLSFFTIIDLGGNAHVHDDWCVQRDWRNIFFNPPSSSKKEGVAPTKDCPECMRITHASATKCPDCDYQYPINEIKYDAQMLEYVRFSNSMNVSEMIRRNVKKEHSVFFEIPENLALSLKNSVSELNELRVAEVMDNLNMKIREWCKLSDKKYSGWHKKVSRQKMIEHLKKHFPEWESPLLKELDTNKII